MMRIAFRLRLLIASSLAFFLVVESVFVSATSGVVKPVAPVDPLVPEPLDLRLVASAGLSRQGTNDVSRHFRFLRFHSAHSLAFLSRRKPILVALATAVEERHALTRRRVEKPSLFAPVTRAFVGVVSAWFRRSIWSG